MATADIQAAPGVRTVPVATGTRTRADDTMTAAQRALEAYVTASARERADEALRATQTGATAAYNAVSKTVTRVASAVWYLLPDTDTPTSSEVVGVIPARTSSELVVSTVCHLLASLDPTTPGLFERQPTSTVVDVMLTTPAASRELRDPYVTCQVIRRLVASHPNTFYNPSEGTARRMRVALLPILRQMAETRGEVIGQLLANHFLRLSGALAYAHIKQHNSAARPPSNLMTALGFPYNATGALDLDLALIGTISLGAHPTSPDTVPAFMTYLLNMFRAEWAAEAALFRQSPAHTGAGELSQDPLQWALTLKRFIALNPDLFLTPTPALQEAMLTACAPLLSAMISVDTSADTLNKGKQGEHEQFSCAHIKAFFNALSRACGGAAREDFVRMQSMLPGAEDTTVVPDRATLVTALGAATYHPTTAQLVWKEDKVTAISAALRADEGSTTTLAHDTSSSSSESETNSV